MTDQAKKIKPKEGKRKSSMVSGDDPGEFPWVKVTFTEGRHPKVEMHQWQKINAKLINRMVRAINREKNVIRKEFLRDERRKQFGQ